VGLIVGRVLLLSSYLSSYYTQDAQVSCSDCSCSLGELTESKSAEGDYSDISNFS
jgi:hypothetical protein